MKYNDIFKAVSTEFSEEIALCVVQIMTIQMSLKPKLKELTGEKSFENRVIALAKDVLWEADNDIVDQAIQVWRVTHDWGVRQSMTGLGGCEKKTFKQLMGIIDDE